MIIIQVYHCKYELELICIISCIFSVVYLAALFRGVDAIEMGKEVFFISSGFQCQKALWLFGSSLGRESVRKVTCEFNLNKKIYDGGDCMKSSFTQFNPKWNIPDHHGFVHHIYQFVFYSFVSCLKFLFLFFRFLSISHNNHHEIQISVEISAKPPTSTHLNQVLKVQRLSPLQRM